MAEGGQLPWKIQTIDSSRGPPADYAVLKKPLPQPPNGVEWKQDGETKEWRLIRIDDGEEKRRRYKLEVGTAWNERAGRAEPTLVPVPKADDHDSEDPLDKAENLDDQESPDTMKKEAVENVDYLVHTVLPTDTLPGLCLRYRTKATTLRQLNKFSGSNLNLAPFKLIIPLNGKCFSLEDIRLQDKTTPEYKLQTFLAECPYLAESERRAYLELNDWDLVEAVKSAKEDDSWEKAQTETKKIATPTLTSRKTTSLEVHVAVPTFEKEPKNVLAPKSKQDGDGLMVPLLRGELELAKRRSY